MFLISSGQCSSIIDISMKFLLCIPALLAVLNIISATAINDSRGKAPTKKLNDGNYIPTLALGTYGKDDIPKMRQAIKDALEAGYRHIDTAALYGNEEEIGKGLADVFNQKKLKREDVFITTKLFSDSHGRNQVVPALRESLKRLGLDYVDLYLIHSPQSTKADGTPANIDILETWQGMEEAKQLGLAKSIGVSNFNTEQLDRLIKNSNTVPAVNQIEVHPSFTQEQPVADCKSRGIAVMAYSPFGFFVSRDSAAKKDDPRITNIAKKYNKSVTQVILRYLLDRDLIPVPKSTNAKRIQQNIDVFDFQLSLEEIATISSFNTNTGIFN